MPYPADLGTTHGRIVIDNSAPELDGDTYTLDAVVQPIEPPELVAVYPPSFTIGGENLLLHAIGSGSDQSSRIVFAGSVERTTFVSESELTTWLNAELWTGPDPAVPLLVRTQSGDTDPVMFAIVAA